MARRFFVASIVQDLSVTLDGPEAHHLIHVMRAKPGDETILFDGTGFEYTARVERLGRDTVELLVSDRCEVNRELPFRLTLGVALPKGDRQRWLAEKAVELGVTRLVPLLTGRGVAQPVAAALIRLQRTVIEASKQCGRNRLMEISPPQSWPDYIAADPESTHRWFAHPEPQAVSPTDQPNQIIAWPAEAFVPVKLAIGPEGGLTNEEVELGARHKWKRVDLGPRILKIETAAIFLATMVTLALANPDSKR